jgi:hypothetical protein
MFGRFAGTAFFEPFPFSTASRLAVPSTTDKQRMVTNPTRMDTLGENPPWQQRTGPEKV